MTLFSSMPPLHKFYLLLIILIIVFSILYKKSLKQLQYWRNKNVPHPKPFPFIGNLLDVITLFTGGFHLTKLYNQFQTPYFGMYISNYPYLIIKDPELIRLILIKDFQYFTDRLLSAEEECDSLTANFTFFLKNPRWKHVRSKLAPLFTITKVRGMLSLMNDVADEMMKHVREKLNTGPLDVKNVFTKYALDTIIAVCALGIKAHCFKTEHGTFMVFAKNLFEFSWRNFIVQSCHLLAFRTVIFFKLKIFDDRVCSFIRELGWEALRERTNSATKRDDVTDLIKQMLEENLRKHVKFGTDRAIAQVGTILIAAFETVSSTMTFALCEMCLQPGIQNKVREEINTVLSRFENVNNEALEGMKYLHMVILETLRKYPFLLFLDRTCTKDYRIPNSNVVIEKGTPVIIPLLELHYNSHYFPNPTKFDPQRFADSSLYNRTCYLPFGKGPRICLGEKLALQEVKLGLIRILSEYRVDKSEDTPSSIELTTKGFITGPKHNIKLLFRKID